MDRAEYRNGFSRIGCLVIFIIIILILFGLLFPALMRERECSRTAHCLSNLKSIQLAIMQYASDNKDTYPWGDLSISDYCGFIGIAYPAYGDDMKSLTCPSSHDKPMEHRIESSAKEPFSENECKKSLSYAYGHNKGKPWNTNDHEATRILADKYATHDYEKDPFPKNKPINHNWGRHQDWRKREWRRNYVTIGYDWGDSREKSLLEANPEIDINAGNPDAKHDAESDQTGADWWSDPPEK